MGVRMPKYRIIFVKHDGDPCNWQLQERFLFFFWRNKFGNASSAHTVGTWMLEEMRKTE